MQLPLIDEVIWSIADKVQVTITGQERSRLVAARPVAPDSANLIAAVVTLTRLVLNQRLD